MAEKWWEDKEPCEDCGRPTIRHGSYAIPGGGVVCVDCNARRFDEREEYDPDEIVLADDGELREDGSVLYDLCDDSGEPWFRGTAEDCERVRNEHPRG